MSVYVRDIIQNNCFLLCTRAQIFKLLIAPGIDSTELIPCENQLCRGVDSRDGGGWGGLKNEVDHRFKN
jgi:hypothetical protein